MEILKNQNLLVLGTEGIEINREVKDQFEVTDGEDIQVIIRGRGKVKVQEPFSIDSWDSETPSLKSPI